MHNFGVFSGIEALAELVYIQSQLPGKLFEIVCVKTALILTCMVFIKIIIILPESILVSGTFAGF